MSFVAMPAIPSEGVTDGEVLMYSAVKQNIEQLTGQGSPLFSAVTRGAITVAPIPSLSVRPLTVSGAAYTISNVQVAPATEVVALASTVQQCVNDITTITNTLNALISQLKGS
jgi:hypothetical protein